MGLVQREVNVLYPPVNVYLWLSRLAVVTLLRVGDEYSIMALLAHERS